MMSMTGKMLRDQREKLGILQKQVAKALGITPVFLGRVENGYCELPPKRARAAARVLEIPLEQIEFAMQHDQAESLKKKIKK